ncbi:MAG: ROK family protein [Candidatus Buchananbacteria bacterium]
MAIGGNLGGSHFSCAGVNDSGTLLTKVEETPINPNQSQEEILGAMAELVNGLKCELVQKGFKVVGFGTGAPGPANFDTGVIGETPNMPTMRGCRLNDELSNRTELPVKSNNDGNLTVFGESRHGAARGYKNVFGNTLGTGLGGGLVINDEIYTGEDFSATELAKMPTSVGSLDNSTIEQLVSTGGIMARYHSLTGQQADPKEIEALAKGGDKKAQNTYDWFGKWLGFELAWVQGLLAPDIMVIGGKIAKGWDLFAPAMFAMLQLHTWKKDVLVVPAALGEAGPIIGGASLFLG